MTSENPHAQVYQWISRTSLENVPPPITSENPPIEERCGLEEIDTIAERLLVLAPIDQVAEVVAQLGVRWERDVYGQTIGGCGLLVFQFRGHSWTGILNGYMTDQYRDILNGL